MVDQQIRPTIDKVILLPRLETRTLNPRHSLSLVEELNPCLFKHCHWWWLVQIDTTICNRGFVLRGRLFDWFTGRIHLNYVCKDGIELVKVTVLVSGMVISSLTNDVLAVMRVYEHQKHQALYDIRQIIFCNFLTLTNSLICIFSWLFIKYSYSFLNP